MKIHLKRSVETEAFFVVLTVRENKQRKVLGIFNKPTERVLGWGEILAKLPDGACGRSALSVLTD